MTHFFTDEIGKLLVFGSRFGAVTFHTVFTLFEIWAIDHKLYGTD
jgi:hypothetical protein